MIRWARGHQVPVVAALLVVMSLLAMGMSYRSSARQHAEEQARERFTSCQARYNETNNLRTRLLTEAAEKERQADRRVTEATAALWLNPKIVRQPGQRVDPAVLAAFRELQAALASWERVTAEVDRERQANPVPPPPSEVCGGP